MKNFSLRSVVLGTAAVAALAIAPVAKATPLVYIAGSFTTTGNATLQLSGGTYTLGYKTHITNTANAHYDQSAGNWIDADSEGYFAANFDSSAGNWYTTGATQVNAAGPNKYVTGRSPSAYTFTSASIGDDLTPSDPFEVITESGLTIDFYITEVDPGSVVLSVATTGSGHSRVVGHGYSYTGEGYVNVYNGATLIGTETGSFSLASDTPATPATSEPFQLTFTADAPEPSGFILLGSGLLAMALVYRRKMAIL